MFSNMSGCSKHPPAAGKTGYGKNAFFTRKTRFSNATPTLTPTATPTPFRIYMRLRMLRTYPYDDYDYDVDCDYSDSDYSDYFFFV